MYNNLGGSDEDFATRNLIIGLAYILYGLGALRVASNTNDEQHTMNSTGRTWSCVIGAVIFTTSQIQDLKDQEGDKSRDRKTAPLVLGDSVARWTVAIPIFVWSVICPIFWRLGIYASATTLLLGLVVIIRLLMFKGVSADKQTWKIWSY
jgi:4-hydroxybenzoate polyprenyltransferase